MELTNWPLSGGRGLGQGSKGNNLPYLAFIIVLEVYIKTTALGLDFLSSTESGECILLFFQLSDNKP